MILTGLRFVVCTYNLWSNVRWLERKAAVQSFIELHQPDILTLQELHPDSRLALDQTLAATHSRVQDPFEGWAREGNIYWNNELFEEIEHGAEPIGQLEEYRRLFWVRLKLQGSYPGETTGAATATSAAPTTLLVATAHYTWPGNSHETATGLNVRIEQARNTLKAFDKLGDPQQPLVFTGDLNDQLHPINLLQNGGLINCFSNLGEPLKPTYPALPTANDPRPFAIDWIFSRGPLKAMQASVVDFFMGDLAPSDHKPVIATYRLHP